MTHKPKTSKSDTDKALLTFKVKHNTDLSVELEKGVKVAEYGIRHRVLSSAKVSHFGLPSAIANAVLRKYAKNYKAKSISHIVLPINNQTFRYDTHFIQIPCLNMSFEFDKKYHQNVIEVKCLELDDTYAYITCEVDTIPTRQTTRFVGVDRNSTGHALVAAVVETGKVLKVGKGIDHVGRKYRNLRKHAEIDGAKKKHHKHRESNHFAHRERNIINDKIHKSVNTVIDFAESNDATIVLEDLTGIREDTNSKHGRSRSNRANTNSWPFYKTEQYLLYKCHLRGVPIMFVNPAYTSQMCSRCHSISVRDKKKYTCTECGHVDHADVNAAFNIGVRGRSIVDRDTIEREN